MPDSWTIIVAGRSYGPYTVDQMETFVGEGRLAPQSVLSTSDGSAQHSAAEDPIISAFFRPAEPVASPPTPFFTAGGAEEPSFGRIEEAASVRTHFIIVADMKSRSISGLEEEIFNLGPAYPIMPQAWILASESPINLIRQTLVQKLGKLDMIFIADATHNKAAWFNFGPEADSRIRRIWQRVPEQITRRAAG